MRWQLFLSYQTINGDNFTIYRADQCPSRGELSMQSMAVGLGLITVSPDYYGFGVSDENAALLFGMLTIQKIKELLGVNVS